MKKFFSYLMISMCLLGTSVVTSCGSDDDAEVALDAPKYSSDAALYHVTDDKNDTQVAYIELTSAGNYYIEYKTMAPSSTKTITINDVEIPLAFTSEDDNITRVSRIANFQYGKYTKNADGSFNLEGKGTLTIKANGNQYTITITTSASVDEYTATKESAIYNSGDAGKICRSWRMKKVYLSMDTNVMGMTTHISEEASNYTDLMNKLSNKGNNYGESIEEIDYISFNNTGSYVVKTSNSIRRGFWSISDGKLYLKKNSSIGLAVSFTGKKMKLDYTMSASTAGATSVSSSVSLGYEFEETLVN